MFRLIAVMSYVPIVIYGLFLINMSHTAHTHTTTMATEPPSYRRSYEPQQQLHHTGLVHRHTVLGLLAQLVERLRRRPMYRLIGRPQILDKRRHGPGLAEIDAIRAPVAAARYRLGQLAAQHVVGLIDIR